MGRLIRPPSAFKRYMQMSSTTVFVFVEGFDHDPYFYGRVCDPVLNTLELKYEIVAGWRLQDYGGKQVLLNFFQYLSTTNCLLSTFNGKRVLCLFFVDKDLDDILNEKIPSQHVVYTRYYSVENYLFVHGDLIDASASASSL